MLISNSKTCLAAEFRVVGICHYAAALQVPNTCTDLNLTLLYISTLRTYTKLEFIRKIKWLRSTFASCNPARVLAAGLPRQDHVLINTKQFVRLHKNSFNEMLCKLDSSEYARSFEQNPALLEDPRDCSGLSTFVPVLILTGLASRPCRCWSTRFFFFFQH